MSLINVVVSAMLICLLIRLLFTKRILVEASPVSTASKNSYQKYNFDRDDRRVALLDAFLDDCMQLATAGL